MARDTLNATRRSFPPGWIALTVLFVAACTRGTPVSGEVTLEGPATRVEFPAHLTLSDARAALCLEFARPGDSHQASALRVVLVTPDGARDTLRAEVDRTGEASVCLRDSVPRSSTYIAAEFGTPRPVVVRRIEWHAPPTR